MLIIQNCVQVCLQNCFFLVIYANRKLKSYFKWQDEFWIPVNFTSAIIIWKSYMHCVKGYFTRVNVIGETVGFGGLTYRVLPVLLQYLHCTQCLSFLQAFPSAVVPGTSEFHHSALESSGLVVALCQMICCVPVQESYCFLCILALFNQLAIIHCNQ
jgi:hypothetical protein